MFRGYPALDGGFIAKFNRLPAGYTGLGSVDTAYGGGPPAIPGGKCLYTRRLVLNQ
jgi:hypothetical protein